MLPEANTATALRIAYRCGFDNAQTTDAEREAILSAMIDHLPSPEADTAARILHHRREAESHQLQLKALLGGVVGEGTRGRNRVNPYCLR